MLRSLYFRSSLPLLRTSFRQVHPSLPSLLARSRTTLPALTTHLRHRTMATTTSHFTSSLNAPSPFVVAPGSALDNLLPGYTLVPATADHPAYAVFSQDIQKSPNDDRLYRSVLRPFPPRSAQAAVWQRGVAWLWRKRPESTDDARTPTPPQARPPLQWARSAPDPGCRDGQSERLTGRQSRPPERPGGPTRSRALLRAPHVHGHGEGARLAPGLVREGMRADCLLVGLARAQYPGENEYTEFLTQNSGSSNAFTGMDQTCY